MNISIDGKYGQMIFLVSAIDFSDGNFVLDGVGRFYQRGLNLDKLTYAANTERLAVLVDKPSHIFAQSVIGDYLLVERPLDEHCPQVVVNFLAERNAYYYSANPSMLIERELEFMPADAFEAGINKTLHWYLTPLEWLINVRSGAYLELVSQNNMESA